MIIFLCTMSENYIAENYIAEHILHLGMWFGGWVGRVLTEDTTTIRSVEAFLRDREHAVEMQAGVILVVIHDHPSCPSPTFAVQ